MLLLYCWVLASMHTYLYSKLLVENAFLCRWNHFFGKFFLTSLLSSSDGRLMIDKKKEKKIQDRRHFIRFRPNQNEISRTLVWFEIVTPHKEGFVGGLEGFILFLTILSFCRGLSVSSLGYRQIVKVSNSLLLYLSWLGFKLLGCLTLAVDLSQSLSFLKICIPPPFTFMSVYLIHEFW